MLVPPMVRMPKSASLTEPTPPPRKRVAIIGAGAAGMAAAWSLSRFPDKFDVTVIEPSRVCGGAACTFDHEYEEGKSVPINYGVQGGSPNSHQNTIEMMRHFGYEVSFMSLLVSFGEGGNNWKNYEHSDLQERLKKETKKFGKVLKWIYRFEFITTFMTINRVLKMFKFSDDFRNRMVYPLVALFFGTGNQTPSVSASVIARVFLDESLAIFSYDEDYLLNQTPTNVSFPNLEEFYDTMKTKITHEHCRFLMGTLVTEVHRERDLITLKTRSAPAVWRGGNGQQGGQYPIGAADDNEHSEAWKACSIRSDRGAGGVDADLMRIRLAKVLPVEKGWECPTPQTEGMEQWAKGKDPGPDNFSLSASTNPLSTSARSTLSASHSVQSPYYHAAHEFDELIMACPANVAKDILGKGTGFWEKRVLGSVEYFHDLTITHTDEDYMKRHNELDGKAFYFIKTYEERPEFLEMGFELTGYQPELEPLRQRGEKVYQTIYLNEEDKRYWTINDLDKDKVLDRAWWSAFSHTYKHFRSVVPWVWTIQGHKHTWYAGSWTLFNTHDIAISSGFACAERLGAPYPFPENKLATMTYDTVLNTSHMKRRRKPTCFGGLFAAS